MANNMDKGLYEAPQGLEALAEQEPEIDVDVEPETPEDGVIVDLHKDKIGRAHV